MFDHGTRGTTPDAGILRQGLWRLGQGMLELGRGLQDLFFPLARGCLFCGGEVAGVAGDSGDDTPGAGGGGVSGAGAATEIPGICAACQAAAHFPPGLPLCTRCSRPLDGPWVLCPDCAAGTEFSGVAAAGLYQPPLSRAIVHLKYHGRREMAAPLAALLAQAARHRWPQLPFAAVVPVPLHPRRLRERGYNQAELLARELCQAHPLPLRSDWLQRCHYTSAQARLGRQGRQQNAAAAFTARDVPEGSHLLLIDDVLTTGATARAAVTALLAAGAARVSVAVVAVSPKPVW